MLHYTVNQRPHLAYQQYSHFLQDLHNNPARSCEYLNFSANLSLHAAEKHQAKFKLEYPLPMKSTELHALISRKHVFDLKLSFEKTFFCAEIN